MVVSLGHIFTYPGLWYADPATYCRKPASHRNIREKLICGILAVLDPVLGKVAGSQTPCQKSDRRAVYTRGAPNLRLVHQAQLPDRTKQQEGNRHGETRTTIRCR